MDEFAVAGDEKAGRAECDDREATDAESAKEQVTTWWLPPLEASGPERWTEVKGKTGMGSWIICC